MDKRVSPNFLKSGIGFGGSCFPKDLKALVAKAQEVYYRPGILNAALETNETQPLRLVELVERRVGKLKGVDVEKEINNNRFFEIDFSDEELHDYRNFANHMEQHITTAFPC